MDWLNVDNIEIGYTSYVGDKKSVVMKMLSIVESPFTSHFCGSYKPPMKWRFGVSKLSSTMLSYFEAIPRGLFL